MDGACTLPFACWLARATQFGLGQVEREGAPFRLVANSHTHRVSSGIFNALRKPLRLHQSRAFAKAAVPIDGVEGLHRTATDCVFWSLCEAVDRPILGVTYPAVFAVLTQVPTEPASNWWGERYLLPIDLHTGPFVGSTVRHLVDGRRLPLVEYIANERPAAQEPASRVEVVTPASPVEVAPGREKP